MLHRSRVLTSRKKVVTKVLLATWKWKETIPKLNEVNKSFGLKEVSLSNLSKIRECSFEEYDAKRPRDYFPIVLLVTSTIHFKNYTSLAYRLP